MGEPQTHYDVLIVGGGINGAAIARDAAGRGLSVLLVERDDLAAHTSSASTKLIHGGLRYLEQFEFALVGKALAERKVLLHSAPHIIWPLRFVLPHQPHLRPAWMIRIGLFLYDRLGGRRTRNLPGSRSINLAKHVAGRPLRRNLVHGFVYSDAFVMDARLCALNALDAHERGATVMTRTACVSVQRNGTQWHADLRDTQGRGISVQARALVNATGPWVLQFLDNVAQQAHPHRMRLVKGSHIVVPRLFEHDHAYIFQQPDRRIVFAIPYERDFTLIGTTDVEYHGDPAAVKIEPAEIDYLCAAASRYFTQPIRVADVVWSYSGVRPLLEDASTAASEITRDYQLVLSTDGAPLLNVLGGKLTTARKLGEEAADLLGEALNASASAWTDEAALPGGDIANFERFHFDFAQRHPWLPPSLALRLCRSYGSRAERIVAAANALERLGEHFGEYLYQAEVDYLIDHEWARSADDILWRRSKLGLRLSAARSAHLQRYVEQRLSEDSGTR